jgi:hypothetical protein
MGGLQRPDPAIGLTAARHHGYHTGSPLRGAMDGCRMILREKPLSEFVPRDAAFGALAADSVHVPPAGDAIGRNRLNDLTDGPYVVHLRNAVLYPVRTLSRTKPTSDLPAGLRHRKCALLLTAEGEVFADSFENNYNVPLALRPVADGGWEATLPAPTATLRGDFVYSDFVTRHFGHALMDLPARLWHLAQPALEAFAQLPVLGFGVHGLGPREDTWPSFLKTILRAAGLAAGQLSLIDQVTQVESLWVFRRISPHGKVADGQPYYALMQRIGDALQAQGAEAPDPSPRIYLSRSKLADGNRAVANGREALIERIFAERGFAIVHPQDLPLAGQVALVRGAQRIAGMAGSQMHLGAFRRPGPGAMLRIAHAQHNPPWDARVGRHLGFTVTDYLLGNPREGPRRAVTAIRVTDAQLHRLATAVDAWLDA